MTILINPKDVYQFCEAQALLAAQIERLSAPEPKQIVRLKVRTDSLNLPLWLEQQDQNLGKMYWRDRQGLFASAGLGQAERIFGAVDFQRLEQVQEVFERLRAFECQADPAVRYYGKFRFQNALDNPLSVWKNDYDYDFVLPQIELNHTEQGDFLICNIVHDPQQDFAWQCQQAREAVVNLKAPSACEPFQGVAVKQRNDSPSYELWQENIARVLSGIENGVLRKVVLARMSHFELQGDLKALPLIDALNDSAKDCYHFCFQNAKDQAFIGLSPERLFLRQGLSLSSEALAGTRPRGESEKDNVALAIELLSSEKDIAEHQIVVQGILEHLQPLCTELKADDNISLVQLSRGQHLFSAIEAQLEQGVHDGQILHALHPTAAVGGEPKQEALQCIEQLEPFDRGYYAAPVGWVSKDSAEFIVGIRSALIEKNSLYLFSGAGIVPGSDAHSEWQEIENKISNFTHELHESE